MSCLFYALLLYGFSAVEIQFAAGLTATERPYVSPYSFPAGHILPYASQRVFLPSSMPTQQPPTSNLVETYNSKFSYKYKNF